MTTFVSTTLALPDPVLVLGATFAGLDGVAALIITAVLIWRRK